MMKNLKRRTIRTCTVLTVVLAGAASALTAAALGASPVLAAARRGAAAARTPSEVEAKSPPIDINTADVETLVGLPGIGPAIAQRVVDYRKEHGPFKTVEELLNVRGIGDRLLARLRDRVTVGAKQ